MAVLRERASETLMRSQLGYSRDGRSFLPRSKNEHPTSFRNDSGALGPQCLLFKGPTVQVAADEAVSAVFARPRVGRRGRRLRTAEYIQHRRSAIMFSTRARDGNQEGRPRLAKAFTIERSTGIGCFWMLIRELFGEHDGVFEFCLRHSGGSEAPDSA